MTVPWEAMDADHPDHGDWVAQAGRCFASHRHPTDYIVLRYGPDFPPEKRGRSIDGRWMDAPDPLRLPRPPVADPFFRTVSVAEPTGRYETRDDGVLAEVWEVRLVADNTPCCDYRDHSPEPCACPEHPESNLHPLGTKPWPEA